ncbi:hypothetical protein EVJ58_g9775 [Rhodofomes roseus]|uniref:Uncharacterized protein n=1 Tax=Rhodofomes roseus TaxID=34475 RepID=A0A4Y9XRU8_9APHY|nr:hypothetical protein EVJ58_g9775 [Rhodofomes roseus]
MHLGVIPDALKTSINRYIKKLLLSLEIGIYDVPFAHTHDAVDGK